MSRPMCVLKHFRHVGCTFRRLHHPVVATHPDRNVVRWRSSPPQQVEKKSDVDAILSRMTPDADMSQAVALLKALRVHVLFHGQTQAPLHGDARFQGACTSFERGCRGAGAGVLVSGLRSLLELGLPPSAPCVQAAQEMLLQRMHTLDTSQMVACLYYHHRFMQSPLQLRVVSALVAGVLDRLDALLPSDALLLLPSLHLFPDRALVEERLADLVPHMTEKETHKLLTAMAQRCVRSVPILRAVASSCVGHGRPDLKEALAVLYALRGLHFYHPQLYGHLLHHLPREVEACAHPTLVARLLTVCGHLRWRHTDLLDACSLWIQRNLSSCGSRELVAFVLAAAALNYCPEEGLLGQVVPLLGEEGQRPPSVTLDLAWALAVLDSVPRELLLRVLSKDFYNTLLAECGSTPSNHLKLLNLKGVLRKEHPECVFGCDLYLEPIKLSESPTIASCRQHVAQVLANFVPRDKCLSMHQVTDTGVFIDAEFIMNKYMKPLSLKSYGVLSEPESTLKKLPPHTKRLSLSVLFHRDLTLSSRALGGAHALGQRLLTHAGYTPVTVMYDEFSENKTELQKAKFLLERIKTCAAIS
ncbi:hypothetical protein JTE90_017419 [Oedothorax gibbosus]|uniref:FAST kinase leucine-rich domain-containing protein n=1 Tax=Oedothorax gibbosus TaxID=931172 RepID=A0AAV6U6F4_9ARAC|nr:hypothetical protein JTE90_017419 [Oedothorax gibbosus]